MKSSKGNSKSLMIAIVFAICFVTYNVIVFAISGFSGHGSSFWISYVFMMVAFGSLAATGLMLRQRSVQPRDWLFGYPVLKHSTVYIIAEIICSVLFMLLDNIDCPWWISLVVQLLAFTVYAVFAISCFIAQDTIKELQENVKLNTAFIKMLRVDAEMLAEKVSDPEAKKEFVKFAEQVRFSDPMSNEYLNDIENQIKSQVTNAVNCIEQNDLAGAQQCCSKASLLLTERNKKCKALK